MNILNLGIFYLFSIVLSQTYYNQPKYRYLIIRKLIKDGADRVERWSSFIKSSSLTNKTRIDEILHNDVYIALTFIK